MEVEMKSMRGLPWVAALAVMCVAACNYTVGECYPVGQGASDGVGNGAIVSAGAGPSGDGPQGQAQIALSEDQCNAPDDSTEMGTYIRCRGLGSTACAAQCNAIGAYCVEHAVHPENPSIGIGDLKQCMNNPLSSTCSYCYSNGDVCTFICVLKGCGVGRCTNTGGKGCE
jgi:hypothetical protein